MKKISLAWSLSSLPLIGAVAIAVSLFIMHQRQSPPAQPVAQTNTAPTNTALINPADIDVSQELAQIDQLDTELANLNSDLSGQIDEINYYTADDGTEKL